MEKPLSKSKLMAYRQCVRRLWLEVHHPEWCEDSAASKSRLDTGHRVGEIAQSLYDPDARGTLLNAQTDGYEPTLRRSLELLASDAPLFEAGFSADGAMAFADVLLPVVQGEQRAWRMVEVKSSSSVKDYHRDDAAVQAFVARRVGVALASVSIAHIDSAWVYPGADDYRGLLVEEDLGQDVFSRADEVRSWIADAQTVVKRDTEPQVTTGAHCTRPFDCGFFVHCTSMEPQAEHPVAWLPRVQTRALRQHLARPEVRELSEVPDALLNAKQLRVKHHTMAGTCYFDRRGALQALQPHGWPAYFLDFETIQFAVPIWPGTRPYQQIPFQFSLHTLSGSGLLSHTEFLDLSGQDPSRQFADALVHACGDVGPVFVYNASFEKTRIKELAGRFAPVKPALLAINRRIVDLQPVAEAHYYHPSQQGSWSIKKLLPAVVPSLSYSALTGVQDGGMAMDAYLEAIAADTGAERKIQIGRQLLAYCQLDTYAMLRIWQVFADRGDLRL